MDAGFGATMRKIHNCLVFLLLFVGLPLAVPAADLPDTAYDESEVPPYESSLPISNLIVQIAGANQTALWETRAVLKVPWLQISKPIPLSAKPVMCTGAPRFT